MFGTVLFSIAVNHFLTCLMSQNSYFSAGIKILIHEIENGIIL